MEPNHCVNDEEHQYNSCDGCGTPVCYKCSFDLDVLTFCKICNQDNELKKREAVKLMHSNLKCTFYEIEDKYNIVITLEDI